jgi:hypothetical protein
MRAVYTASRLNAIVDYRLGPQCLSNVDVD